MANYYLYILSSRHHRHLSIGVTPDLVTGIGNQRIMVSRRLRKKRVLQKLVYVETIDCVEEAVEREVELKRSPRNQINKLVESAILGGTALACENWLLQVSAEANFACRFAGIHQSQYSCPMAGH